MIRISPYAFVGMKPLKRKRLAEQKIPDYIEHLKQSVCEVFQVQWKSITNKNRSRMIVMARQIFCYLLRDHSRSISFSNIGDILHRDHTTILYSVKTIEDAIFIKDPIVTDYLDQVLEALLTKQKSDT